MILPSLPSVVRPILFSPRPVVRPTVSSFFTVHSLRPDAALRPKQATSPDVSLSHACPSLFFSAAFLAPVGLFNRHHVPPDWLLCTPKFGSSSLVKHNTASSSNILQFSPIRFFGRSATSYLIWLIAGMSYKDMPRPRVSPLFFAAINVPRIVDSTLAHPYHVPIEKLHPLNTPSPWHAQYQNTGCAVYQVKQGYHL